MLKGQTAGIIMNLIHIQGIITSSTFFKVCYNKKKIYI